MGNKNKGGGGTETELEQVSNFRPGQRNVLDAITQQILANIGTGAQGFGGDFVAGINPLEQQAFQSFQNPQGLDTFQQAQGFFNPQVSADIFGAGVGSISQASQPFNPQQTNQFFDQSIQNPAIRNFEKSLIPLAERFAGQNATSSGAFNRALTESAGDLQTNLSSQRANLLFNTQQAGLNRQLQGGSQLVGAAGLVPGIADQFSQGLRTNLDVAQQQLGAGQFQRGIEQAGLNADFAEFLRTQPEANQFLNFIPTVLNAQPFDTIGVQTEKEQGSGGKIGTIAGALIGAYYGGGLQGAQAGGAIGGSVGGLFD